MRTAQLWRAAHPASRSTSWMVHHALPALLGAGFARVQSVVPIA